jgi:hypothetical protein
MFNLPIGKVHVDDASTTTMLGRLSLINEAGGQLEKLSPGAIESGFDIVIGNPPYVHIQTLKRQDPKLVEYYKQHYESAKKGNYDLYVVFVEAGLTFLKPDGHLAYIMPHKFFNAQYGEPLRGLLAKGHHLRHVVHFGDQQVFPGTTNYVCLLFLAEGGAKSCWFVRVDDLETWLETFQGTEGDFPPQAITAREWNFAVGRDAPLFERLREIPTTLGDIAEMFVGLQTSADPVFLFKEAVKSTSRTTVVLSSQLAKHVEIESELLKTVIRSGQIGPFWAKPSALVLFPYRLIHGSYQLLKESELKNQFPAAWQYLMVNRELLENREHGRFRDSGWWQLYPKNLDLWEQPKVMLPYMITQLAAFYDEEGAYFVNVTTGGFGLTARRAGWNLRYLTGLLNSNVLDWFLKRVSTTFHGGYFAANKQFLVQLPVASPNSEEGVLVGNFADYLLWLNRTFQVHSKEKNARDTLMLGYWEQMLNGLVYELYFPEELHAHGLHLFDLVRQAGLPPLDVIPAPQRLSRLRKEFERVYDLQHPLRAALHDLQTVEEVRIIEGKA